MKLVLKVKRDIMNGFQVPNRRNYSFAMKKVCDLFQVEIAVKIPRKTAIQRRAQHRRLYPGGYAYPPLNMRLMKFSVFFSISRRHFGIFSKFCSYSLLIFVLHSSVFFSVLLYLYLSFF